MTSINDPAVIAEITRLHDAYERALASNDVAALNGFFWSSPETVRFGVNEHLYGAEAVAAYRQGSAPLFTERALLRRSILAIGSEFASVMCEFSQKILGQPKHSRQSQVWIKFPELGWKIAHAHVSNALTSPPSAYSWDGYVDQAAAAMGLTLSPEHRPGVIRDVERASLIVQQLLATPLPDEIELAPTFRP